MAGPGQQHKFPCNAPSESSASSPHIMPSRLPCRGFTAWQCLGTTMPSIMPTHQPLVLLGALAALPLVYLLRQPMPLRARKNYWWLCQRWLRTRLVDSLDLVPLESLHRIGGVDISFVKGSESIACACLVVVDAASLAVVHCVCRRVELTAPYVPGFLAFREVGFLIELLDELRSTTPALMPDAILVDGNGILHPNRFGLACHLGVLCNIPTGHTRGFEFVPQKVQCFTHTQRAPSSHPTIVLLPALRLPRSRRREDASSRRRPD